MMSVKLLSGGSGESVEESVLRRAMVERNWEGRLAAGGKGPEKVFRCALDGICGKDRVENV